MQLFLVDLFKVATNAKVQVVAEVFALLGFLLLEEFFLVSPKLIASCIAAKVFAAFRLAFFQKMNWISCALLIEDVMLRKFLNEGSVGAES